MKRRAKTTGRNAAALAALGVLLFGCREALAADMPVYDVAGHCARLAAYGGDYSASLDKGCIEMEQRA